MNNELIVIEQLPIIKEQLQQIKAEVTEKVDNALKLVCTEETIQAVKKERASLNADFKEFEEKRKEVKKAVLSPYEQFEAVYKECITNTFKSADSELKSKIDSVENELKEQKRKEVFDLFTEYAAAKGIDFITFERANINITLSASLKSLKMQAKNFIDKVVDDLTLIETQEFKDEILVEYKQTLNVSAAITGVVERHKAIEAERARKAEREQQEAAKQEAVEKVEEIAPPTVEAEKILQMTFTVRGTLEQLKAVKQFIIDKGVEIV